MMRQALAGMLWSKQYYEYDVHRWLREHGVNPWSVHAQSTSVRNASWFHLMPATSSRCPTSGSTRGSRPGTWPSHACRWRSSTSTSPRSSWSCCSRDRYLHPNGQIPAYEWNFSDVNPPRARVGGAVPVRARAARSAARATSSSWSASSSELLTNFTWWVNRKDPDGRNLFQGGFLGLDNIGVFDRSAPLPGGGTLEQADGTAWMALYCQCDAADRARAGAATIPPTSTWRQVRRALRLDRRRHEPARRRRRCGTRRTASSTT